MHFSITFIKFQYFYVQMSKGKLLGVTVSVTDIAQIPPLEQAMNHQIFSIQHFCSGDNRLELETADELQSELKLSEYCILLSTC